MLVLMWLLGDARRAVRHGAVWRMHGSFDGSPQNELWELGPVHDCGGQTAPFRDCCDLYGRCGTRALESGASRMDRTTAMAQTA